jgi:hypothetical protein
MSDIPVRASDVEVRPVEWLWAPFVPLRKITALAGNMGQGKSLLTTWLAAMTTTGGLGRPGSVLMLSAEDDAEDTIVPRLAAAGAELTRVHLVPAMQLDADDLAARCKELGNVKLVTVDPLAAYLPDRVDSWKGQHVRRALEPLRRMAAELGPAIVLVQHLNRRGDTTEALARISDSQGIPQLARSVLVWGPDPEDDGEGTRKVLTAPKANLSPRSRSAAFEICESDGYPMLKHRGESRAAADEVVADARTRTQTQEAVTFLLNELSDGPRETSDLKRAAADAGISEKCLRSAREKVARSFRPGGNHGPYSWELRTTAMKEGRHSRHTEASTPQPRQSVDALVALDDHQKEGGRAARQRNRRKGVWGTGDVPQNATSLPDRPLSLDAAADFFIENCDAVQISDEGWNEA